MSTTEPPPSPPSSSTRASVSSDVEVPVSPPSAPGGWYQRMEKVKSSAMAVKNHLTPQLLQLKDKISSKATSAATTGREKLRNTSVPEGLQPALVRAKEGMSILKTKLSNSSIQVQIQAERFQAMGLRLVTEMMSDSQMIVFIDEEAFGHATAFLEQYRHVKSVLLTHDGAHPASAICWDTPIVLYTILAYLGSVQTVAQCTGLNLATRRHIHTERHVWRFCVRYGELSPQVRIGFWSHLTSVEATRAAAEHDYDTYLQMALSKGDWTDAIQTDVTRTYGRVAPHRRSSNDWTASIDTDEELQTQLGAILHALAGRFPDVGYCQGMDYITAHILEHVKAADRKFGEASPQKRAAATEVQVEATFWILVALFESYGLRQMFSPASRASICTATSFGASSKPRSQPSTTTLRLSTSWSRCTSSGGSKHSFCTSTRCPKRRWTRSGTSFSLSAAGKSCFAPPSACSSSPSPT
ncbi:hypothetical protein SPRG_03528 [Saprolegnia parasitica CBS 223.65]|uniref:Rab-GAP TBC domain-containing protein n=1 Tax=Saprolegnia parasitica (strain CBS 223.65) TaxID=695850 RepID=A0A067CLM0_SAPPC|nr:hypothetical protein SPRG_03528 [Saprolegnia parasitica CBS 223.65]KDO31599.1 hypothetical protein SPRG_03528 [Saprolegnia parasitica CBS 223.65]|eukprot:XP_012197498.1 hypothetical protein SPRG_03528 [Saprolegnia parasitica CBS 223.65]